MAVWKEDGHWFLGNERGEFFETSFLEIVGWLDTLWDIRQLALAPPETPTKGRTDDPSQRQSS